MNEIKIAWWSAGITSAVACKMALELYDNVELYYIETGSSHPDNERFKKDCEKWYGKPIHTVKNTDGYKNHFDVIRKTRYVNGPDGARCTLELKKKVRFALETYFSGPTLFESDRPFLTNQIFGFEYSKKEINRAIRFLQQYPNAKALLPLIEKGLTKDNCAAILAKSGIALPVMYKLGYANNNCIGCNKGAMDYWNKIRIDFPLVFDEMSYLEQEIGHSCIKGLFLKDLKPEQGRKTKVVMPDCGSFCEIEFENIPAKSLEDVIDGKKTIYQAAAA